MRSGQILTVGAICSGLAVAAGAFGAHALQKLEPRYLAHFETGARYHMYHGLALVLCGLLAMHENSRAIRLAAWCFVAGILLFSGSLYALALTQIKTLGAVTPFGGVAFLVGWVALAVAGIRRPSPESH